jgi:hypothetical protein
MSEQPVLTPLTTKEIQNEQALAKPDDTMLVEFTDIDSDEASAPTLLTPNGEEVEAAGDSAGATWHNNKKVTGLWSINQNRNVYAAISDLGWKKLADNNDTCVVALNILAANAKLGNRNVTVREDGGKIVEMYVW